jgi:tRNA-guanine family transglycosylase
MKNKKKRKLRFLCAGAGDGRLPDAKVEGLLFSTVNEGRTPASITKTAKTIAAAKPEHVMIDSGGFQILSREKKKAHMTFDPEAPLKNTIKYFNLAPCHVVDAAIKVKADIMIALDYPIRKLTDPREQDKEFREKLPFNVSWAIETAKLRKKLCPHIELFNAVQAYNLMQFEEFYNDIKHIDFDGLSLPVRNMPMLDQAKMLLKMHEWGIKKVHILGSSSLPVICVCAYMTRYFDWISFDATSWCKSAHFGGFILPTDLSNKKLNLAGSYDPHYKCQCKSCKGMSLGQIAALEIKERRILLMTHNYLAIQNLCRRFDEGPFDIQYLEKYLSGSKRRDLKKIMKAMIEIEQMCSSYSLRKSKKHKDQIKCLYGQSLNTNSIDDISCCL